MGFKFWSSWGFGIMNFEITIFTWVFKYLVPNLFSFCFNLNFVIGSNFFIFFQKSLSRVIPYSSLRGPKRIYAARARSARVWWDGDVVSNGSFNFLYTLCAERYIYIYIVLIYILKNCHQHSYGFQNLMSSWRVGTLFSKLLQENLILKISFSYWSFKNKIPTPQLNIKFWNP